MNKRVRSLIDPNTGVYLAVLCIFDMALILLGFFAFGIETQAGQYSIMLAIVETVAIVVLVIYFLVMISRRQKQLSDYIESVIYETDRARSSTLAKFPLPMAVFALEDMHLIWANDSFFEISGCRSFRMDATIADLVPGFTADWLKNGQTEYPELVELKSRKFRVLGNPVKPEEGAGAEEFMAVSYWVDQTRTEEIRQEYEDTRPVSATIVIDNYDELTKNRSDRERNNLRDTMEDKLAAWAQEYHGMFRRFDRDRYIAFFEERDLQRMREDKFSIVEDMHSVVNPIGIEASLSIGFGEDAANFSEALQYADLASELALSRGGDQTVVKNRTGFEFFGGRGTEVEKRTKVKSRVMANTLRELIRDSSRVYVMGHRFSDLDCLGAAVGVCCVARQCGVRAYIVMDEANCACPQQIAELKKEPDYQYAFLNPEDAGIHPDANALLVVVDTNRPEQVQSLSLLDSCSRVAVIDHHRVGSTSIRNAALGFIEPYASSASELMTEILQEVVEESGVLKCEANAILAGIVLDTKSFTIRTGERTFDAASSLRRLGADTVSVKKMLQTDMEDTVARYRILEKARLYRSIAIAAPEEPESRIVLAKVADELLNITGVEASVVLADNAQGGVFISARSIGEVNVQILMEKLGGGGNRNAAAAQLEGITPADAEEKLKQAIDEYFDA